jgi:hypothetical protein
LVYGVWLHEDLIHCLIVDLAQFQMRAIHWKELLVEGVVAILKRVLVDDNQTLEGGT